MRTPGKDNEKNSRTSSLGGSVLLRAVCSTLTSLSVSHLGFFVKMLLLVVFSWKLVTAGIKPITSGFYKLVLVLAIVAITSNVVICHQMLQHRCKLIFNVKSIYRNSLSLGADLYF